MKRDIISSAIGIVVLTLLCGLLYPLVITGISQVAFPGNANGQKVYVDGKLVGSKIIGQNFGTVVLGKNGKPEMQNGEPVTTPDPRYFQGRPSATVPAYNAASSTFSNLGPNSKATLVELQSNIQAYLGLNCPSGKAPCPNPYDPSVTSAAKVPVDAADSSASGLDPEISIANADIQAYRIAAVRHLSLDEVHSLISKYTLGRGLGFAGEPGVDVLELNLALDRTTGTA
jgi:potassium-transporting ATPase KdpC subunit